MAGQYTVLNSRGTAVATINPNQTTGNNFSVELLGQAITPYKQIISDTQYHLLENFANSLEPTNAVEGQFFYKVFTDGVDGQPHFYNGTKFLPMMGAGTSYAGKFEMLPTATAVDFATVGITAIFTAPNNGTTFHPTGLILIPNTLTAVVSPPNPQFNLFVGASEDVFSTTTVIGPDVDKSAFFSIGGNRRFVKNAETLNLEITSAGSAGVMTYDAVLLGFNDVV
jgi:hypothetical protein